MSSPSATHQLSIQSGSLSAAIPVSSIMQFPGKKKKKTHACGRTRSPLRWPHLPSNSSPLICPPLMYICAWPFEVRAGEINGLRDYSQSSRRGHLMAAGLGLFFVFSIVSYVKPLKDAACFLSLMSLLLSRKLCSILTLPAAEGRSIVSGFLKQNQCRETKFPKQVHTI